MKNFKFIVYTFLISCSVFFGYTAAFATTIDPASYYAWNDIIGWIDFYNTPGTVYLNISDLTGYANSSIGYIAFDCATSPNPPADCATTFPNWKVTRSGSSLSGWAWNDAIGWISLNCNDNNTCASSNYQVSVSGGEFSGWAWNDVIGWISFNCSGTGTCGSVDYKVKYLPELSLNADLISSTFDTGAANGVIYNTILYQGTKPTNTDVRFQLAVSDSASGPWNFSGYDGTDTTYYTPTGPNIPIALNASLYKNKRYFRYRIFLATDTLQSASPEINKVIVTWSR